MVNGVAHYQAHGCFAPGCSNLDLWGELAQELYRRRGQVAVIWVKGHAEQIHIDRGITTALDKCGNDSADALASAAAASHAAPHLLLQAATRRKQHALALHWFAIDVLAQRRAAEERLNDSIGHVDSFPSEADPG